MLINIQVIQNAQVDDDVIRMAVLGYWKHLRNKYSQGEAEQEDRRVKMAFYMSNRRRTAQAVSLLWPIMMGYSILIFFSGQSNLIRHRNTGQQPKNCLHLV